MRHLSIDRDSNLWVSGLGGRNDRVFDLSMAARARSCGPRAPGPAAATAAWWTGTASSGPRPTAGRAALGSLRRASDGRSLRCLTGDRLLRPGHRSPGQRLGRRSLGDRVWKISSTARGVGSLPAWQSRPPRASRWTARRRCLGELGEVGWQRHDRAPQGRWPVRGQRHRRPGGLERRGGGRSREGLDGQRDREQPFAHRSLGGFDRRRRSDARRTGGPDGALARGQSLQLLRYDRLFGPR